MPLVIFNMWLTRHTYEKHNSDQPHLNFCTVVGGTPKLRQHSKSITVFYPAKNRFYWWAPFLQNQKMFTYFRLVFLHGALSGHLLWTDKFKKESELSLQAQHLGHQPFLRTHFCGSSDPCKRRTKSLEAKPPHELLQYQR